MSKEENKVANFFNEEKNVQKNKKINKATKLSKSNKKINMNKKIKNTSTKMVVEDVLKNQPVKRASSKRVYSSSGVNNNAIVKNRFINKVINFLLISLFLFLPLFFTKQTFQGILFEKGVFFYLVVMVIAFLTLLKFLFYKEIRIKKTPLDKIIPIFAGVYILSAVLSVDRWHSVVGFFNDPSRGVMMVLAMIVIFYLIISNFTVRLAQRAFKIIVGVMVLISFYTLISGLGIIPKMVQSFLPFTSVGSIVGLAILLVASIPLIIVSFLKLNEFQNKKIAVFIQSILILSLLSIMINLIMLKVFVIWAGLIIGMVILIVLLLRNENKQIGGHISKVIIFVSITIFILIASWAKSDYGYLMTVNPKVGLPTELKVGLPISFEIVRGSVTSNVKQVLLGSGPATFGYDFAKFHPVGAVNPSSPVQYLYQGDGFLAEAIPTIGLIGSGLLIAVIVMFLLNFTEVLCVKRDNKINVYTIGLFVSSVILLVSSLMGQINGGVVLFGVLLFSLAMFFIIESSDKKMSYYVISLNDVSTAKFFGVIFSLVVLMISLGSGVFVIKSYLADTYFKKALIKDTKIDQKEEEIRKAIRLRPEEGVYYVKLAQTILYSKRDAKDKKLSKEEVKNMVGKIVGYSSQGASLIPNDVKTLRFLAGIYEITGAKNIQAIQDVYKRIIELEPKTVEHYVKLGDLYLAESSEEHGDKIDRAIETYKVGLNINPRSGLVYSRMARAYYQKKDINTAIERISKAIIIDPKNISYKFTLGVLYQIRKEKIDMVNAEKIFRTILTVAPQNIDVLSQLGLLYEQTGHKDEAKKQYQLIVKMLGDAEKFQKIKEVFKTFIKNIDEGKSNVKEESMVNMLEKDISKDVNNLNVEEKNNGDDQSEEKNLSNENKNEQDNKNNEKITVNVSEEGPVNVRSEGSLTGKKLTTIKKTEQFSKVSEKGNWVQIIIPAQNQQEEIIGWVHKKFVVVE